MDRCAETGFLEKFMKAAVSDTDQYPTHTENVNARAVFALLGHMISNPSKIENYRKGKIKKCISEDEIISLAKIEMLGADDQGKMNLQELINDYKEKWRLYP